MINKISAALRPLGISVLYLTLAMPVYAVAGDLRVDVSAGGEIVGSAVVVERVTDKTNAAYFVDPAANPSMNVAGSVTAPTFVGSLTGNASTATTATNQSGGTVNATTGSFSSYVYTPGYMQINSGSPTIYLTDTNEYTAAIHNNSNLLYILSGCGVNQSNWCIHGGYWPLYINLTDDSAVFGGNVTLGEGTLSVPTAGSSMNNLMLGQAYLQGGYQLAFRHASNGAGVYWQMGAAPSNNFAVSRGPDGLGMYLDWNNPSAWGYTSDRRLKTNIRSMPSSKGLETIMRLNPVIYNWASVTAPKGSQYGFVAQEVQQVAPELVSNSGLSTITWEDGAQEKLTDTLGVKQDALIPYLVKALQQQQEQIDELKKEIEILKTNRN